MDSREHFRRFARIPVAEQRGRAGEDCRQAGVAGAAGAEEKFTGFRIEREETSVFPGDWAPLKGKNGEDLHGTTGLAESEGVWGGGASELFAGAFSEGTKEAAGANPAPEGIVVIFDSADGGIAGATLAEIQRMAKGEVSREAFWTQSYLDPVEAFHPPAHP